MPDFFQVLKIKIEAADEEAAKVVAGEVEDSVVDETLANVVLGDAHLDNSSLGEPITPEEAEALFAAFTGGAPPTQLLNSVTPKLEAIAGKELSA